MSTNEKLALLEPTNPQVSIRRQCELLQLNRSTYYHQFLRQDEIHEEDQELMKEIDKIHTRCVYYGSRKIAKHLTRELKRDINRKRVRRLMRIMGIEAVSPQRNTSKPAPGHQIYPYLLKGITATHPNHIWGVDITYIPLLKGWMYLVAIMDWYSRYVLAWELSDSMAVGFCLSALTNALGIGVPEIHNSDQGSQFTSKDYLSILQANPQIAISMDSRGRAFDNIFTERLWKSVKYEEVYLHDYQSPREARESITEYFETYNNYRIHQALGYVTPAEVYFKN